MFKVSSFAAGTALAVALVAPSQSSAAVIEDFEGYADSATLNADLFAAATTGNATVTLGATDGVGGSQSFNLEGANNTSPFFTAAALDVADFSLAGVESVQVDMRFLGGSNEGLRIALYNEFGTESATGSVVGTETVSASSFETYTIDTSFTGDTVTNIRFFYGGVSFGVTSMAFDNIRTVVPEPSSLALIGLGGVAALRRRRLA